MHKLITEESKIIADEFGLKSSRNAKQVRFEIKLEKESTEEDYFKLLVISHILNTSLDQFDKLKDIDPQ